MSGPRIGFYHLQRSSLEDALPRLVDKALEAGHRVVVMAGSPERVSHLDALLWTWDPNSWLPHGAAGEGDAELQPVLITGRDENPNGADVLLMTDGVVSEHLEDYARCLNLFDGRDEGAVEAARALWKQWKERGYDLTYYQQNERGGWQEKARSGS